MSAADLNHIQTLIEQLDPNDQARLLQYLAPRINGNVPPGPAPTHTPKDAWRQFRVVGERLAHSSCNGVDALTESVGKMRR